MSQPEKTEQGDVHESEFYTIKYYRDSQALYEPTDCTTKDDAKDIIKLREADIVQGVPVSPKMGRVKLSELLQAVVDDYEANERRTTNDVKMRIKRHLTPFFGNSRASVITTAHIRKFMLKRKDEEASNAEINRELAVLSRAFNLGLEDGKIMMKPKVPRLRENNVRKGYFETPQFEAVRRNLPEDLQPVVTFAFLTGWRTRSEVQTLQWSQVNFKHRRVYLEPGTTKNSEARWFPFTTELEGILLEQKRKTDDLKREKGIICPFVFHRNGKPIKSFYKTWRTACKLAGVPGRIMHDFRRTAIRNIDRRGITQAVGMKLTGHKTPSVYQRYNIVSDSDLEEAAGRLEGPMVPNIVPNRPNRPNRLRDNAVNS